MSLYSKEFLEKTVQVWQPHTPVRLSLDDAREIVESMTGLLSLLMELDRKYGKRQKEVRQEPTEVQPQQTSAR